MLSTHSHLIIPVLTLFLLLAHYIPHTHADDAPSTSDAFTSVLKKAKLQAPTPDTSYRNLDGFSNEYFYLRDNQYMEFRISGESNRSELRQLEYASDGEGDDIAWFVTDSHHRMRAVLAVPTPQPGLEEFTFMQILCQVTEDSGKPALRVTWRRSFESGDETCEDCIVAVVRLNGDEEGETEKFMLGQRQTGRTEYIVDVQNSELKIFVEGYEKESTSLDFFNGVDCYFKAGAYVNKAEDEEAEARTKFSQLDWDY